MNDDIIIRAEDSNDWNSSISFSCDLLFGENDNSPISYGLHGLCVCVPKREGAQFGLRIWENCAPKISYGLHGLHIIWPGVLRIPKREGAQFGLRIWENCAPKKWPIVNPQRNTYCVGGFVMPPNLHSFCSRSRKRPLRNLICVCFIQA